MADRVNLMPSTRMIVWGLVFGLVAVALYNNVATLGRWFGPRS